MRFLRFVKPLLGVAVLAGAATGGYLTRDAWMPWLRSAKRAEPAGAASEASTPTGKVLLTDQAITNLGLTAQPLTAQAYWKTILVPGAVVDRPGRSDRGVVTPAAGVVAAIRHLPGDTVRPGEVLFTLKLLSESLYLTQSDLFKATQDIKLAEAQRKRLTASGGAVAEIKVIEVANQITRLEVARRAYRQELQMRGLTPEQIDSAAEGTFVKEIQIAVPSRRTGQKPPAVALVDADRSATSTFGSPPVFEVQELKVELGQQVQAGQTLCLLANHQELAIEGRAFPDETPFLERAVREGWPVEVDFQEAPGSGWPAGNVALPIDRLSNTIDPANRTFAFLMMLGNQSRIVRRDGRTQLLWRFRPGQRVRLHVRVEKLENVFVLPAGAVARDGPEAFIFTQNVNTFERRSVHVLLADRDRVVIANDGSLPAGLFVAQTAAAQLNRMSKSGSQSNNLPKGYHIHADGSLHKNESEGE